MLRINMEYKKSILFIRLNGNLNKNTCFSYNEYTIPVIKDYKVKYLVLNINGLNEMDEFGYDTLIKSGEYVKRNKGNVLIIDKYNHNIDKNVVALNLLYE